MGSILLFRILGKCDLVGSQLFCLVDLVLRHGICCVYSLCFLVPNVPCHSFFVYSVYIWHNNRSSFPLCHNCLGHGGRLCNFEWFRFVFLCALLELVLSFPRLPFLVLANDFFFLSLLDCFPYSHLHVCVPWLVIFLSVPQLGLLLGLLLVHSSSCFPT